MIIMTTQSQRREGNQLTEGRLAETSGGTKEMTRIMWATTPIEALLNAESRNIGFRVVFCGLACYSRADL